MMSAGMAKIIVMMVAIMSVAESIPTLTPMDHALPDAHTTTTHARHGHLLQGMLGDLESYVFDDVVEFMFHHLGEELPQARNGHDKSHTSRKGTGQSCIAITGYFDSSIICLNIFTALSVAGLALLMQFLFYACVSNLCPEVMSQIASNGGGSSGMPNITNIITIDNSNDVSVEQNDIFDLLVSGLAARAGLQRADEERSDLDVDTNLGEDSQLNNLRANEVSNEQNRNGTKRSTESIHGVEQAGGHNKEETEGKALHQDNTQRPEDKEGGRSFTLHIPHGGLLGRLLSWSNNWDMSLPSLRSNTNICPILSRYVQR